MSRWKGRTAIVTGASAGIGYAIAQLLAQKGMNVYGVARNVQKVKDLATDLKQNGHEGKVIPYTCDVTIDDDVTTLFEAIKMNHGGVDVCINNAGIIIHSTLLDGTTEQWRKILDTNIVALCLFSKLSIASMKERGVDDGHIINLGSYLGHKVIPDGHVHFYVATKYAVRALTEGLRMELREAKSHIRASEISPGVVETEIRYRSRNIPVGTGPTKAMYESLESLQAEDIAESVWHILNAPKHVEINDIIIRATEQEP